MEQMTIAAKIEYKEIFINKFNLIRFDIIYDHISDDRYSNF